MVEPVVEDRAPLDLVRPPHAGYEGVAAVDRDLDARIVSVRRTSDQTFAEIDAGSRDGVRAGWVMTVGRPGGFVANLRIISVEVNRATGVVELEQKSVEPGLDVYARSGDTHFDPTSR